MLWTPPKSYATTAAVIQPGGPLVSHSVGQLSVGSFVGQSVQWSVCQSVSQSIFTLALD